MSGNTNAPWEDEELLRQKYYEEDLTIQELADEWGTTYDTIRYYKDKYDVPNKTVWDSFDAKEIESMYWEQGMSLAQIGAQYDAEGTHVLKYMVQEGIPRRTPDQEKGSKWKDADRLEQMYWENDLSLKEIGDELGCSASTVGSWMKRLGVEREKSPKEMPPPHRWRRDGYEVVRTKIDDVAYSVAVHRLTAIAMGELDVGDYQNSKMHVHHKNGVPWDNRPENLEVLSKSEHHTHHYQERIIGEGGKITR